MVQRAFSLISDLLRFPLEGVVVCWVDRKDIEAELLGDGDVH